MTMTWAIPEQWLTNPVRVALVGCGGTGSQLADGLASMAVTLQQLGHPGFEVTLFDPDSVSPANLGRQRFCAPDVGHFKALLLQHRLNLFYGLNWAAEPRAFAPANARGFHLVITATDKALFRARLGAYFGSRDVAALWLDTGNGPRTGQVVLGHLSGRTLPKGALRLPNVFDLYPDLANMAAADREEPSCSMAEAISRQEWPVNRVVAQTALSLLWQLFRHGQINAHGAFIDTTTLSTSPLPIDPQAWSLWGYKVKIGRRKVAA